MLRTLRIENLAIIDHLELELGPGLSARTGETGAGKSIIVGALGLVLGARAATDAVRHGAQQGSVEALFDVSGRPDVAAVLAAAGLPEGDGDLVVRRVISRAGRSKVYVNGSLVTLQTLSGLTGPLVDMSTQHEQYSLLDAATHLDILDAYAGLLDERGAVEAGYRELEELRREHARLVGEDAERAAREDYLRFQLDEIDRLALRPGEDEELEQEQVRLRNAETLRESAAGAEDLLYEGREAATASLERARGLLARLADLDASAAPLAERLEQARIEIEDIAFELRAYREGIDAEPARLREVDDRLDAIRGLARKHGPTADAILSRRAELAAELDGISHAGERRDEVAAELKEREAALLVLARGLSERRREAARRLERDVRATLTDLAMDRCQVRMAFLPQPSGASALGATGVDRVELRVATNVGEGLKPLARTASGGELSRILLALKRAFARTSEAMTSVFDEVDVGIGGAVAETVGRLLAETAARQQVLCITHLPQVASFAHTHYRVEKHEHGGRTTTAVRRLSDEERVEEIARMLGGVRLTDRSRAHAAEMIRHAAGAPAGA